MIVSAYINEFSFKGLRPGDAERLTHVNFAFAVVKNGRGSVDHWKNSATVREFVRTRGHIKAILSVGGWGAGGFSPAVATAEGREPLAQSLVDIANDYGFDGIDMDWEFPGDDAAGIESSPDDKVNYTLFMELLRQKLGKDKILSMAAGGFQSCIENLELDKLMKVMDFINLMTYDMCSWEKVGYHTALYPTELGHLSGHGVTKMYESAGVSPTQLILGASFYAKLYKDVDGINAKVTTSPGHIHGGYAETIKRAEVCGYTYDEVAETAHIYDAKNREFINFDNPRSLAAKVNYVKSNGLAGIMFWEYHFDDENSTLLKGLHIQ